MIKDYLLIDKVYGNYIWFQRKIIPILKKIKINKRQLQILEIGCGTGITTKIIVDSRPDIILTAIDIDNKTIKYATNSLKNYNNINFIKSDALTFLKKTPSYKYDVVISPFTIHNLSKEYRNKLYPEIFRVLKAGSIFLNADKFVADSHEKQINALKYRISTYIDTLIRLGKYKLLKEWVTHYIDDHNPNKIMKIKEERDRIIKNKFEKVRFIFKSELEMLATILAQKL